MIKEEGEEEGEEGVHWKSNLGSYHRHRAGYAASDTDLWGSPTYDQPHFLDPSLSPTIPEHSPTHLQNSQTPDTG
jgi:hypothetical protein